MKHIHDLLQQRDQVVPSSDQWVLHEACNRNALQHRGTFKNALARKLDDVIIPIFSGVITFIDQFSNLNLIRKDHSCTTATDFWLAMFNASNVMSFKYGAPVNMADNFKEFDCKLPFFWIIKEAFDVQWDTAESVAQKGMENLFSFCTGLHFHGFYTEGDISSSSLCDQLCSLVASSPIGQVITAFSKDSHYLYTCYAHDFLRSVHHKSSKTKTSDIEYGVRIVFCFTMP